MKKNRPVSMHLIRTNLFMFVRNGEEDYKFGVEESIESFSKGLMVTVGFLLRSSKYRFKYNPWIER